MFTEKFDKYAQPGDNITFASKCGAVYKATLLYDPLTTPGDYGFYSETDKERWSKNDWWFAELIISARVGNAEYHLASALGCEVDIASSNDYLTDCANELLKEAKDTLITALTKQMDAIKPTLDRLQSENS